MDKIKLILLDQNLTWLKKFSNFLNSENDLVVIGTATNRVDVLKLVNVLEPDLILMDINLSNDSDESFQMIQEIHQIKNTRIMIISTLTDEEIIADTLAAGAINYILKEYYRDVPNIIRRAFLGILPTEIILKRYMQLKKELALSPLTPAEKEVFKLIEQGKSTSEIAKTLNKAEGTVKIQTNKIFKKLQIPSREYVKKFLLINSFIR